MGLNEKKSEMKDVYSTEGPAGAERGYVIQLMKTTYYLQRKNINASPPPSIAELKNDWPYFFHAERDVQPFQFTHRH